jgi:hypothetical protein
LFVIRLFSSYEAFEAESDDGLPEDFLEMFEGEMFSSAKVLCVFTALGVKPACDVEGFFDSRESFEKLVSLMSQAGLNCYVKYDPPETEAELIRPLFEEEGVDMSMIENYEVKARIFLTRENYSTWYFRKMRFYKKVFRSRYDRMYGEFLQFKDRDIEAFIQNRNDNWDVEDDSRPGLRPEELAEKYGEDLSSDELKAFEALQFCLMENSEERFREGVEEMRERKQILEQSRFDADKIIEESSFH